VDTHRAVIDWLLEGDPAIRWQALKDIAGASPSAVAQERAKIATEGWGSALLAEQAADGSWGGGLYNPKWTSTFYTLLVLKGIGLARRNEQARGAAELLLEPGRRSDGGLNFSSGTRVSPTRPRAGGSSELCITGMGLGMLATYLDEPAQASSLVDCLLSAQLEDGGWNCQRHSHHGSFHTTNSALEGLRDWALVGGDTPQIRKATTRGQEFFLAHRLFRSHRTGKVVKSTITRFAYPHHWYYDVMRGLDYFQSVEAPRDERFGDAIELLHSRRKADGRWQMAGRHRGREYFVMEENGEPSRWNTLRALRVLRWWDG
jgi:hypothetical protein